MVKLIFGFPVHEKFETALDLYHSIKKFNNDPLVLFASNSDLGKSIGNLKKIRSKRRYRWGHLHNFMFDAFEEIHKTDYDYYINLDSDCLFANYGFKKLFKKKFDFSATTHNEESMAWAHGNIFLDNIEHYKKILDDLGLRRKDKTVMVSLAALQIFSKRAINFIVKNLKTIENNKGYLKLMKIRRFPLDETIILNILKDAGFIPLENPFMNEQGPVRWDYYWSKNEIKDKNASELGILYHPVRRDKNDEFRKAIIEKTKLYKNK